MYIGSARPFIILPVPSRKGEAMKTGEWDNIDDHRPH